MLHYVLYNNMKIPVHEEDIKCIMSRWSIGASLHVLCVRILSAPYLHMLLCPESTIFVHLRLSSPPTKKLKKLSYFNRIILINVQCFNDLFIFRMYNLLISQIICVFFRKKYAYNYMIIYILYILCILYRQFYYIIETSLLSTDIMI